MHRSFKGVRARASRERLCVEHVPTAIRHFRRQRVDEQYRPMSNVQGGCDFVGSAKQCVRMRPHEFQVVLSRPNESV